jgi:hypothetical protein
MTLSKIAIWKYLLLLLIPFVAFELSSSVLYNQRNAFMAGGDPMYAYLLNGLTLAQGSFDLGHTDNPGTTVQCLSALVIRIVYYFNGTGSMVDDVISNPEKYLMAARMTQLILAAVSLLWLGAVVLKKNQGRLIPAMLMQCMSMVGVYTIIHSTSFAPEGLLIVGGILLVGLCIIHIHEKNANELKFAVMAGIICGFLIVTKFPALCFIFIPLLAVKSWRNKSLVILSTVLSFLFFCIPIFLQLGKFFSFITKIITHQGQYGAGEAGIFHAENWLRNLKLIMSTDWVLTGIILISVTAVLFFYTKRTELNEDSGKLIRLLAGILMAMLINLLMTARHFNFHYLIPSQMLILLQVYVLIRLWHNYSDSLARILLNPYLGCLIVITLPYAEILRFKANYYYNERFKQPENEANKILFGSDNVPRLYINSLSNSAGPEPAMYFGWAFSGNIRTEYTEKIHHYYPGTILYNPWESRFSDFGSDWSPELIALHYPKMNWYLARADSLIAYPLMEKMISLQDSAGRLIRFEQIYRRNDGYNRIFRMTCDTARARKAFPLIRYQICDFEQVSGDTIFVSKGNYFSVRYSDRWANGLAHSGTHSFHLTSQSQFGGECILSVSPGYSYELTAWRKGNMNCGGITAVAGDQNQFYKSSAVCYGENENGWEKVYLRFTLSPDFEFSTVKVFFFNYDSNGEEIWFDDLEVSEYKTVHTNQ